MSSATPIPAKQSLRFRQIHLDFHTSPAIPEIGVKFDKTAWQQTLRDAAVDSITIFAKCHHGWSYHPTEVGQVHPGLDFDLLRAQYDACKEAGINAPIYLSAGVDNVASHEHPEWRTIDKDGAYCGWTGKLLSPGFHMMDFHSPYLDYLCDQIREVVRLFPDCDGIFLDIISQPESCGKWSMEFMLANGLDPECEEDRKKSSELALEKYFQMTTAASLSGRADMPVFHNSGHIARGRYDLYPYFSHLELESLPTGGWGYDHFPLSAKYACNLPLDFLGMTGKFHTTWGEFGGFKHPNALRYECAAMLAYGSKCSVGDQLHPNGVLDRATYAVIGEAYREVAAKEAWCSGSEQVFDIGILSSESEGGGMRDCLEDDGAARILLEGHFLFGVFDRTMDFSGLRALILPDRVRVDDELHQKLSAFVAGGGKLILSSESGMWKDRDEYAFDVGAEDCGLSEFQPDFILPREGLRADYATSPQVMYDKSRRLKVTDGESLGDVYDPYFNRTYLHFCSHQHAPPRDEPSGFACGVKKGPILLFSHPVFAHYRGFGGVTAKDFVLRAIREFLGDGVRLQINLPSTARVTLTRQADHRRHVLHLLYAPTVHRGGKRSGEEGGYGTAKDIDVVEDLPPIRNTEIRLAWDGPEVDVTLEPGGVGVAAELDAGRLSFVVPEFACHQMIALTEH